MIDTIIVSGGNIHSDFALDFLKKNKKSFVKELTNEKKMLKYS